MVVPVNQYTACILNYGLSESEWRARILESHGDVYSIWLALCRGWSMFAPTTDITDVINVAL